MSYRIIIYAGNEPEKEEEIATFTVPSIVVQIRYHCDNVFVATSNGSLLMYQRNDNGGWSDSPNVTVELGSDPVSCLLPLNATLYAACGKKVSVHCAYTGEAQVKLKFEYTRSHKNQYGVDFKRFSYYLTAKFQRSSRSGRER